MHHNGKILKYETMAKQSKQAWAFVTDRSKFLRLDKNERVINFEKNF